MPKVTKNKTYSRGKATASSTSKSMLHTAKELHHASHTPPVQSPSLDKHLVLQIVIAKLEASKTCDWFILSREVGKKVGGKKGKEAWTGTELHDLYHSVCVVLNCIRSMRNAEVRADESR